MSEDIMRVHLEVRTTAADQAPPLIVHRTIHEVVTPTAPISPAPQEQSQVPVSGFRRGLREVGHGLGWVTAPAWWPVVQIVKSTKGIVQAPWISAKRSKAWVVRAQNDLADFEAWTPAQRKSVQKQQGAWAGLLGGGTLLALPLPGAWALIPSLTVSALWWLRSHDTRFPRWQWLRSYNGKSLPHFDIVRWAMYLPQPERDSR